MRYVVRLAPFVLAGVLAVGFAGFGTAWWFGVTNPFRAEVADRSQPALLTSIQDISEYHAAVGNFEVVLDVERDAKWLPDFIAGERSLFVAAGTVDAYVDLSGLAEGDLTVSGDGQSVTLRLPEAELGKPNLDQDRTYLFSQNRGLVNRVTDALSTRDQQDLYRLAEQKLSTAAEQSALTRQADENTRTMLVGMFEALDMTVTFTD
ncbi:DUF4230 domain-containing protein [Phycicoccus sp. CSK15P-2]|uniref:DUF4230 domain-containing protein n=1 Tax=Phycicoccus sp. CSK15P-2 TaxID=2807627 RepID=UPI001950E0D4|nr:DUF4230 domain-containing protein [Phycicoccus sp. CSK15P-2]MBM6404549.1 DUF4230 domain-containing protein [Phycicoccus sp. CSK15P-2]